MTREANLHTFAAGNKEASIDYEFFTRPALGPDYTPFTNYISSNSNDANIDLEEMWTDELIEHSKDYINDKIQGEHVKHGDIFFVPAWGSACWQSFRVNGLYHVVENELGVKHLHGGPYTEGMPVGEPRDYPGVTYDVVYQELNKLAGFQESFENAWYKWYKGMGTD
tara:strand:- start:50 stop:550 length:501 start_codon:yes stop_codon:yes gene_type:complete